MKTSDIFDCVDKICIRDQDIPINFQFYEFMTGSLL